MPIKFRVGPVTVNEEGIRHQRVRGEMDSKCYDRKGA